MGGLNIPRLIIGGIVAAFVMNTIEWIMAVTVWADRVAGRLQQLGLTMAQPDAMIAYIIVCLLIGWVLIFFYAVACARFGPGIRTAVIVSFAMWIGGFVSGLIDYHAIGVYPDDLLLMWAGQGLVELVLAGIAGSLVYKDSKKA